MKLEEQMRLIGLTVAAALVVSLIGLTDPFRALAQPGQAPSLPKPVTVTNFPTGYARFQLVGFTTNKYNGDMGGPFGAAMKCQAEFPGSRMCTYAEAFQSVNIPEGLSGLAWINADPTPTPEEFATDCEDWQSDGPMRAHVLTSRGGIINLPTSLGCETEHAIACCAQLP